MSRPSLCAVCTEQQPAKYSCPRCAIRTCCLACSRAHKAQTGCSGERDRTSYVPLNQYGYAELMNDYVFLEHVGRQVDYWGREILRGGYASAARRPTENALRGASMRVHGKGRLKMHARQHEKRSFLVMQLSLRDVHMDVLPAGMENAKRNRSHWDSRKRNAFFTIEFKFYPPSDPVTRQRAMPLSLLTHKNDWEMPIWQLVRSSIKAMRKHKNDAVVDWLGLDGVGDSTAQSSVLCLMKCPKLPDDPPHMKVSRPRYYKLDWESALSTALRRKHFVEFPSILISDENSFDGVLVNDEGAEDLRGQLSKYRKLDPAAARRTLTGLVGAYRSDDEDESAQATNLLRILDDYSGDSSDEGVVPVPEEERDDADGTQETLDVGDSEEEVPDFRNILDEVDVEAKNDDLMQEDEDDNDMVEWGDDEIAEDEAKLASLTAILQRRHSE